MTHSLINKFYTKSALLITLTVFLIMLLSSRQGFAQDSTKWIATWSTAPYAAATNTPPSPYLADNTLRQIIRVSIGGDTLRFKFSNRTSSTPVTINSVNIAVSMDSSTSVIDSTTITPLTFGGNPDVTMSAYSEVTSDPVAFDLAPGTHLAITIYYGDIETAADMTFHYGSRTDSYIMVGDQSTLSEFTGATVVERWYTLSSLEVIADNKAGAVAVLGNSITDGYGIHDGRNKWPDTFSERLLADTATSHVSVLNLGIGATLVSTSGVSRFQQDVLDQSGLRWVIVFYGVNDIGGGNSAATVINAYNSLIAQAHAENIRIYGATITPFNGSGYYSTTNEAIRQEVNEWIRTPGNFDGIIDFDLAIRNPDDPSRMMAEYSNDWLHPNIDGYNFLGESVPLDLFLGADTTFTQPSFTTDFYEAECAEIGGNWNFIDDGSVSNGRYVTVKAGTQSLESAPSDSSDLIFLPFTTDTSSTYNLFGRMNNPSYDDDSFWVKVNDGDFALFNGLVTSGWQWVNIGTYDLDKGDHELTIGYREDGATLDKIAVTNSTIPPSGLGDDALNICQATSSETDPDSPRGFGLNQNYPNPFNPNTIISYQLPVNSRVELKVFDMLGREVAVLADGLKSAGTHTVDFGATGLSSGIYIYQLKAGDRIESKKMMLVK